MPQPLLQTSLSADQAEAVQALQAEALAVDGVAPLSEQTLLSLRAPVSPASHVLVYAGQRLGGYAQLDTSAHPPSAELVVAPSLRGRGLGTALWQTIARESPRARVWAHGNLPSARNLAAALGLSAVRELHKMSRPLGPEDVDGPDAQLPAGFTARPFEPGRDERAWLATNAAAFAAHPEQGRLDLRDLRERMSQPWFDPAGLILVEADDSPGRVAAFHWTKVDPAQRSTIDPAATAGEVYVVGVHPAYQGRGLGVPVTALGLSHLASLGLPEVVLYVDGDNDSALRTYSRLGFHSIMVDVMYARTARPGLSG